MRSDSDLHEPRTNAEQSETGDDLRVSYESLANCLKTTVHLARAYSSGTGRIFEDAMTIADRLADRALAQGTEARRAETSLGSVHDGPVGNADALNPGGSHG